MPGISIHVVDMGVFVLSRRRVIESNKNVVCPCF